MTQQIMSLSIPVFPRLLKVEPTNACNLKCVMCPRNVSTYPIGYMKFKLFKKIVDQCKGKQTLIHLFFLGEPLLHPQLYDMLFYASSKNVSVGITTNGTLLNEENAEWLLKYSAGVTVSVDGVDADSYEKIRVGADFNKVLQNVECLCRVAENVTPKKPVKIVTIVPDDDSEAVEYILKVLSLWKNSDLRISPIQRQKHPDTFWIKNGQNIPVNIPKKIERKKVCRDGLTGLVIRWDGKITFCCGDINTEISLGDANYDKIEEIWNSPSLWDIRKKIITLDFDSIVACKKCTVMYKSRSLEFPADHDMGKLQ